MSVLQQIVDVMEQQAVSKRALARRSGLDLAAVRRLCNSASDAKLSTVGKLADALDMELTLRPRNGAGRSPRSKHRS